MSEPSETDTVVAFDFGLRHIGVAVGNRLTRSGRPLTVITAGGDGQRFDAIGRLLSEWRPQRLVVGRPCHPDGSPHPMTLRCERFARQLEGRYRLPVHQIDERYTSVAARSQAAPRSPRSAAGRRAPRIDAEAAAIILQQYWNESV
jgi:putative Holliday junction resolvase